MPDLLHLSPQTCSICHREIGSSVIPDLIRDPWRSAGVCKGLRCTMDPGSSPGMTKQSGHAGLAASVTPDLLHLSSRNWLICHPGIAWSVIAELHGLLWRNWRICHPGLDPGSIAPSWRLQRTALHHGSRVFARDHKNRCCADMSTSSGLVSSGMIAIPHFSNKP